MGQKGRICPKARWKEGLAEEYMGAARQMGMAEGRGGGEKNDILASDRRMGMDLKVRIGRKRRTDRRQTRQKRKHLCLIVCLLCLVMPGLSGAGCGRLTLEETDREKTEETEVKEAVPGQGSGSREEGLPGESPGSGEEDVPKGTGSGEKEVQWDAGKDRQDSGSGQDAASPGDPANQGTIPIAPLLDWEDPDNENLADMMQHQCSGLMVRLSAGALQGSGVLYRTSEDMLWILTTAHVFADAPELVAITFGDGWETESSEVIMAEDADIAMIQIPLEKIPEEHRKQYLCANVNKESFDALASGDGCIAMGSRTGVAAEAYEGTILEPWIYMEDYGQYMIWVKAEGMPGMSGGGLFDRNGHFLGILSGRNEDGELAVVPLSLLEGLFCQ